MMVLSIYSSEETNNVAMNPTSVSAKEIQFPSESKYDETSSTADTRKVSSLGIKTTLIHQGSLFKDHTLNEMVWLRPFLKVRWINISTQIERGFPGTMISDFRDSYSEISL